MTETLTPSRLWKQMTAAQRLAASRSFWTDDEAVDDQVQAVMLISQQKRFRPKTVVGLDVARKAKHLASLASLPESIAARVLVLYHLSDQRAMMGRFLDALGIVHEEGLIKEDSVKPDPEKLAPAAAELGREFPADDVRLYLTTLLCQDPETWGALEDVVADLSPKS